MTVRNIGNTQVALFFAILLLQFIYSEVILAVHELNFEIFLDISKLSLIMSVASECFNMGTGFSSLAILQESEVREDQLK